MEDHPPGVCQLRNRQQPAQQPRSRRVASDLWSSRSWNLLGGAATPIFNGGQLLAQKRAAEAGYRASFADYQQVVVALGQVADALNALADDTDSEAAQ
jgi:outer membrane protein TolC